MAATSGPLADFARLSPGRKVGLFAVAGLLLGALYYQFGYKSLDEKLSNAKQENQQKVAKNKELGDDIPKFAELKTHIAKLRRDIDKNQAALPSEAEVPAFFETLEHKVTESGVEIAKWTKQNEVPVESFVKVPVDIEISGTFMQIKRFFASLVPKEKPPEAAAPGEEQQQQQHERIVSIENLTIGQPVVKNREIILTAKFTAVTFRQEDKPPPSAAKPGQPAPAAGTAPPAAPPPAAPPPAPMPTAPTPAPTPTTPAGAKARVEENLQKGEAQTRDAVDKAAGSGSARLKGGL